MAGLILTSEQMQTVANLGSPLVVSDPAGNPIGVCSMINLPGLARRTAGEAAPAKDGHFTPQEIEQALRNRDSTGTRYTTQQVLDFVRSLESGQ